jgi:signal transduction histidine kinase
LGLALVRQIARRHGGDARCEPTPDGRHLRFIVTLARER